MTPRPEVWLRGPVDGVPAPLQPIAHALLQAVEEIDAIMHDAPQAVLWTRPNGVASIGFHLQHIVGVLDRLATYARGEMLSDAQREYLAQETHDNGDSREQLVARLHTQVDAMIAQLRSTDMQTLHEPRAVGRARLPSNVLGLLVHAAEHTQRHLGQLLVTVRVQCN